MARKLRIQYEGAIYHVTLRGVERRRLFTAEVERQRFLERLGQAGEACGVRVHLFCLMVNHVHLVVETPQANLSAFMHKLQTAYTVYFNVRHQRAGHLMQGRFGAQPVAGDEHLLKLSRYIHLNPVFVGGLAKESVAVRRAHLRAYAWSSYRGYAGVGKTYGFMDEAPILALMGGPVGRRRAAYRRFVETGLAESDEEFQELLKASRWGLGDRAFQDRIRDLHRDLTSRVRRSEDVSFRRVEPRLGAEAVLQAVAGAFATDAAALRRRQYDCVARAVAAWMLGRFAGMNQRDVGALLGMGTGSAVCQQLRRLRERHQADRDLADRIARVTAALAKESLRDPRGAKGRGMLGGRPALRRHA